MTKDRSENERPIRSQYPAASGWTREEIRDRREVHELPEGAEVPEGVGVPKEEWILDQGRRNETWDCAVY